MGKNFSIKYGKSFVPSLEFYIENECVGVVHLNNNSTAYARDNKILEYEEFFTLMQLWNKTKIRNSFTGAIIYAK